MKRNLFEWRLWLVIVFASTVFPNTAWAIQSSDFDQQQSAIGVCMVPSSSASRPALRIEGIIPTGPASRAGMEEGDLILQVDGDVVDSNLPRYIATRSPGTSLNVVVQRGRATQDLTVITEERSSLFRRIASGKLMPPNVDIDSMSLDNAQKTIIAALSKADGSLNRNVKVTGDALAYTRIWGNNADQRYSVVIQFACQPYLANPRRVHWAKGWVIPDFPPPYYLSWNDQSDAEGFVKAINRIIWEHSPQMIGQRLLQHDLFEQRLTAWRAAGEKIDPPEEAQRHFVLAQAAFQEKNVEHQAEELAAALEIYPTWPDRQSDLAVTLGELGRYSEAIQHMQMYLELVPNAPDAQQAKQQIWVWQDKLRGSN